MSDPRINTNITLPLEKMVAVRDLMISRGCNKSNAIEDLIDDGWRYRELVAAGEIDPQPEPTR